MAARFGPAGTMGIGSTLEAVDFCGKNGLRAFEMEFVRGVKMGLPIAKKVGELAKKLDVRLSAHCPYFINLASKEKPKLVNSFRHIMQTAAVVQAAGGGTIVFHPAFYQGRKPAEVFKLVKESLEHILEEMDNQGIDKVILGAETTGKHSAFGSLEENIALAQQLKGVEPVVDFAHLYARQQGKIDYAAIFDALEKGLGKKFAERVHCHYSGIEFTEAGERRHLPIGVDAPPFAPLAKLLAERGLSPSIVCESPTMDKDVFTMLNAYNSFLKN